MAAGTNDTNYTVGCFTEVIDSYGASGSGTTLVRVRTKPLTVAQLYNISQAKTAEALDIGNADASKQVITATTDGLAEAAANSQAASAADTTLTVVRSVSHLTTLGRRRRLLASGSREASNTRASLMVKIWSTFALTPITQGDVASLLSNVAGVLDTPSEVLDATAASALEFLRVLLQASISKGVALSEAGSTNVGDSLRYLFATGLFNASDATSLASATNATAVLGLASACQLIGGIDGTGSGLSASLASHVEMFSYRASAAYLGAGMTVQLNAGDATSSDAVSAVTFSAAAGGEVAAKVASSSAVVVRIATVSPVPYNRALKGTAGSAAAAASRLDQAAANGAGTYLLRSRLTVVEAAPAGAAAAWAGRRAGRRGTRGGGSWRE